MEPGMRKDTGKLKWHLIPIPAMLGFVKVWHGGAVKYAEEQWRGGLKYSRIYRPMMSHLNKWLCSKSSYDKELGTHHLMMVAWGCFVLFMYEIIFKRTDLDDRPDKGVMTDEDFEFGGELIAPEDSKAPNKRGTKHIWDGEKWSTPCPPGLDSDEYVIIRDPNLPPLGATWPIDKDDAGRDMEDNER